MIQAQIIQTIAFNLIWQTALIAGVVYLGLKLLPNAQTKTRYMLSLSGLLGATLFLLLLPFLPDFAPNLSIGLTPLTPADNPVFTPAISPRNSRQCRALHNALKPTATIITPFPFIRCLTFRVVVHWYRLHAHAPDNRHLAGKGLAQASRADFSD